MIVRRGEEVITYDVGLQQGNPQIKTTIKWMISSSVGGDEYGHKFALRHFEMEPGGHYPMHKHFYVEGVYLISGKMAFCSEDENWIEINPGDVVYTYRWEMHGLKNVGDTRAVFICCIDCEKDGELCEPRPSC